jgi:hypothetical protein
MTAQLSILKSQGEVLKELGLQTVEVNNADFISTAKSIARCLARKNGRVTMDDVREVLDMLGIDPKHPNSYGAVFTGKDWHFVGWARSRRPSNHARDLKIWSLQPGKLNYLPPKMAGWEDRQTYVDYKKG